MWRGGFSILPSNFFFTLLTGRKCFRGGYESYEIARFDYSRIHPCSLLLRSNRDAPGTDGHCEQCRWCYLSPCCPESGPVLLYTPTTSHTVLWLDGEHIDGDGVRRDSAVHILLDSYR